MQHDRNVMELETIEMPEGPRPSAAELQNLSEIRLDVGLLRRIAARDEQAVADLYDRHRRLLFGLILRILQDHGEAEEVLQDVFVLVWTRVDMYDVALGSPAGWLVRIARNRGIDRLRARNVRVRAVESVPLPLPEPDPEVTAAVSERQRAVVFAVGSLPPEQRVLIEHAYFLGLTQSELAARFRLPLGTVKWRIRTAMLTLRGLLFREASPCIDISTSVPDTSPVSTPPVPRQRLTGSVSADRRRAPPAVRVEGFGDVG